VVKNKTFDYSSYLKDGRKVERLFASLFGDSIMSTNKQDIYEHWDVWTKKYGFVDVKGIKKVTRIGKLNENFHWVEIMGVTGHVGWAYSTKTNYFAFETKDYFIMVSKEKLQEFIKEKVTKEYVAKPEDSLYKLYRRKNRKDVITLVKTIDLIYICSEIIKKND
jgi:hypothetical protein